MIDEVKYKLYSRLAYLLAQMTEPWMVNAENSRKNLQLSCFVLFTRSREKKTMKQP